MFGVMIYFNTFDSFAFELHGVCVCCHPVYSGRETCGRAGVARDFSYLLRCLP